MLHMVVLHTTVKPRTVGLSIDTTSNIDTPVHLDCDYKFDTAKVSDTECDNPYRLIQYQWEVFRNYQTHYLMENEIN